MINEIKQLNADVKRRAFWIQAMAILSLLVVLQADTCKGRAAQLVKMPMADFIALETSPGNFHAMLANMADISILVQSKEHHKPRSWLYAAVTSGTLEKVESVLKRLGDDIRNKKEQNYTNKNFQNLPDPSTGKTPLGKAIEKGYTPIVTALIASPHIDVTNVDNQQRSPLHMAAIFNRKEAFKLIWDKILAQGKANAIQYLFKKDKEEHSVFASAYLPEPGLLQFFNPNLKMFKAILNTIKDSLEENNSQNIIAEIMDLQHKAKITKKYAGKLQYEVNLIKHPKPSAPSTKKEKSE